MKSFKTLAFAALVSGLFVGLTQARAQFTEWARDQSHTASAGGGGFAFSNSGTILGTWDNFSDFGDAILTAHFDNAVTFDNTSAMDPNTTISEWGPDATPIYGQTFIAPQGVTKLNDFTFFISDGDSNPHVNFSYEAFVMTWSGSLLGGGSSDQSGSSILYMTDPIYFGDGTFQIVPTLIPDGVDVTPGNSYFFGLIATSGTVPDGGSSALLLALGFGAALAVRRRFAKV